MIKNDYGELPVLHNTLDNNILFSNNINVVIEWLKVNGITPVPCQNCSKKPIYQISEKYIDNETSFHIPTEKRMNVVKHVLNNIHEEISNRGGINLGIDTNSGWNNGNHFSFIDIDDKQYMEYFISKFPECPIVYGANGVKILFFLTEQPKRSSCNIVNENKDHVGEFYSSGTNKLCLIYGKHPETTPENVIYYKLDTTKNIPTFNKELFSTLLDTCLENQKLELDVEQKSNFTSNYVKPTIKRSKKEARTITELAGLTLSSVISSCSGITTNGNTARGAPFHRDSRSGEDWSGDLISDSWRCHRCGSGGGPLEFLAVELGIVQCSDCHGNIIKGDIKRKLVGQLIKRGYFTDQEWCDYKNSNYGKGGE